MRLFFLSWATVFVWCSCQTDAPGLSEPGQSAEKLYVVKCAKCHELYNPKKYTDADWELWMTKMRKKSKLKTEQFDLIQGYTETLRHPSAKSVP